jgi:putative hemolysin
VNTKWVNRALVLLALCLMVGCGLSPSQPTSVPGATETPQANLSNPASVYCEQRGNRLEIRTASDGSQSGVCVLADGSECDEWAYFRGECGSLPTPTNGAPLAPTDIPTALPVDPADYQGWWTYTHAVYGFSLRLPEDWVVEEITTFDPAMNGHALSLHPQLDIENGSIRLTFRRVGEDARLWPTGVGQDEFIQQGTLEVAGQPARRMLLVCPTGEVTSIWYHDNESQPNLTRGELEFGVIFSAAPTHCEAGYSLGGKVQRLGEMIVASLKAP